MRTVRVPTRADVIAARDVVRRHADVTPFLPAEGLGPDVLLKLETFQPTGSFKVRGALAAVAGVLRRHPEQAVVTASAGNHGLGVAFAAGRLGASATVVVPETASTVKLAALERFPVRVIRRGRSYDEAERHALTLAAAGAHYVSPYNDPDVIAGQGTIALELMEQVPNLATIVAPVGGGGLVAGLALAAQGTSVRVIGVEAERSQALRAALDAGRIVPIEVGATLADGLAGNLEPGSVTVDLVRDHVAGLLTAAEDEIRQAIRFLAAQHGLVAEGSAAAAVAPLLAGRLQSGPGTTAIVLTGRNISPATLAGVLSG